MIFMNFVIWDRIVVILMSLHMMCMTIVILDRILLVLLITDRIL